MPTTEPRGIVTPQGCVVVPAPQPYSRPLRETLFFSLPPRPRNSFGFCGVEPAGFTVIGGAEQPRSRYPKDDRGGGLKPVGIGNGDLARTSSTWKCQAFSRYWSLKSLRVLQITSGASLVRTSAYWTHLSFFHNVLYHKAGNIGMGLKPPRGDGREDTTSSGCHIPALAPPTKAVTSYLVLGQARSLRRPLQPLARTQYFYQGSNAQRRNSMVLVDGPLSWRLYPPPGCSTKQRNNGKVKLRLEGSRVPREGQGGWSVPGQKPGWWGGLAPREGRYSWRKGDTLTSRWLGSNRAMQTHSHLRSSTPSVFLRREDTLIEAMVVGREYKYCQTRTDLSSLGEFFTARSAPALPGGIEFCGEPRRLLVVFRRGHLSWSSLVSRGLGNRVPCGEGFHCTGWVSSGGSR
ncbi:hypothetical protein FA13DRAFT_1769462 [Coprinellus micaceus]|uniref:Uncharacterized protein n=1 Tax=Coprinellus micaceus TaxID=71717 RepID=A0A4Y7U064_COPMI|nr:hypothetical protein FA13DRAFT_1769462 [Coprinellus micaceus]